MTSRAFTPGSERRAHPRTNAFLPVRINVRGKLHMGSTTSISGAGMLVKTDAPCLPGERVPIQLLLESAPFELCAEVVRLTSLGVAFRFDAADLVLQRTILTVVGR